MVDKIDKSIEWIDDGLDFEDVGYWAEDKARLLRVYNEQFTTAMREKWHNLVYIDLFAGSGAAKIKDKDKIIMGSPLVAASAKNPFSKYIFSDSRGKKLSVLKERMDKYYPSHDCDYIEGDCNDEIEEIMSKIPRHSKSSSLLCFCFIDPYALHIKFETIRRLSEKFMDFAINLPLEMDGARNIELYEGKHRRINELLGDENWRDNWAKSKKEGKNIVLFLSEEFTKRMEKLEFKAPEGHITLIKAEWLKLYRIVFFSRHKAGLDFWKNAQTSSSRQTRLPGF